MSPELYNEYQILWDTCEVNTNNAPYVIWAANQIIKNKKRYEHVASQVGCPWYVVGLLHGMEASFNFSTHLYNGDSLSSRTVRYPPGRPKQGHPPFTWEFSAVCALNDDGVGNIESWDIPNLLYFCEQYNGMGYRNGAGRNTTPPRRSPYLWSMTNHYIRGKYVSDGQFDPMAVSAQAGVAAILKILNSKGEFEVSAKKKRDVTWFNVYLLESRNGFYELGIAAKYENSDDTHSTMRVPIPFDQVKEFIKQFPKAANMVIAEKTKPWPGDLPPNS